MITPRRRGGWATRRLGGQLWPDGRRNTLAPAPDTRRLSVASRYAPTRHSVGNKQRRYDLRHGKRHSPGDSVPPMTPAEQYRAMAAQLRATAQSEKVERIAAEWEKLANSYLDLAEHADEDQPFDIWFPGGRRL